MYCHVHMHMHMHAGRHAGRITKQGKFSSSFDIDIDIDWYIYIYITYIYIYIYGIQPPRISKSTVFGCWRCFMCRVFCHFCLIFVACVGSLVALLVCA